MRLPQWQTTPRLLIVDDDPATTELYVDFLTSVGVDVTCALTGSEALRLFSTAKPFHLILVDAMMPVMDGEALMREFSGRFPELRKSVTVVGLSGLDARAAKAQSFREVVDALEQKPSDFEALLELLTKHLARLQM